MNRPPRVDGSDGPDHPPRYDVSRTWGWNLAHAPDPAEFSFVEVPEFPGEWRFCGLPVDSPLGMPAGPLLNGRWILYYAALGFDVLTYKTVRSVARECYPIPNLVPVRSGQLSGDETELPVADGPTPSWAVSFGMPSVAPDEWRADVEKTREALPAGKLLSVSVVGTVQPGWGVEELAADYAKCARRAVDAGADCVETNFSCPNVATRDGQLFQQPESAAQVAEAVRQAIGRVPFIVKIGHVVDEGEAAELLKRLAPHVDALAMTNSVAATVRRENGELEFNGERRGICGDAVRSASIAQTQLFSRLIGDGGYALSLIGVGGAGTADHVRDYLAAGAEAVHIATAAMLDPMAAIRIREDFARNEIGQS